MDGAIVRVCRACAGVGRHEPIAARTARPQARRDVLCLCGEQVAFHEARPVVSASGLMEMCCPVCAAATPEERHARQNGATAADTVEQEVLVQPPPRATWMRYAVGAASVSAFLLVWWSARADKPAAAAGNAHAGPDVREADTASAAQAPAAGPARWELEPTPTVEDELEDDGEPLHFEYPTLADWIHPVPGVENKVPDNSSRRFGAERPAVFRSECGKGHCGVDLMGPRGQPIVAVAWGVVVRVVHDGDRRSGKYVRIEHPDYVYTSYMHLDDIPAGIEVGREVNAGDVLGTLGRSGIKRSAPHLHFSLEIAHGNRTLYIDPSPYLADATVLDIFQYRGRRAARRHEPRDDDQPSGVSPDADQPADDQPAGESLADDRLSDEPAADERAPAAQATGPAAGPARAASPPGPSPGAG